jgi:hypothetical protein
MNLREIARTVETALSSWSKTARLCVVVTVAALNWIIIIILTRR